MALVFKNINISNQDLVLDSKLIIGVMGSYSKTFIQRIKGQSIGFLNDKLTNGTGLEILKKNFDEKKYTHSFSDVIKTIINEFEFNYESLLENIKDLSDSERQIFKYVLLFMKNPKIIVLEEPFLYLDSYYKKKIIAILNHVHYKTNKTILICSNDSDIIYSLCKKVLFIKANEFIYDYKEKIMNNDLLLQNYGIIKPQLCEFVSLAKNKGINLDYVTDVRDLIKDVYRNV